MGWVRPWPQVTVGRVFISQTPVSPLILLPVLKSTQDRQKQQDQEPTKPRWLERLLWWIAQDAKSHEQVRRRLITVWKAVRRSNEYIRWPAIPGDACKAILELESKVVVAKSARDFEAKPATHLLFIGWSKNHFNNLHFRMSLETQYLSTCAAGHALRFCCDFLKRRFVEMIVTPVQDF